MRDLPMRSLPSLFLPLALSVMVLPFSVMAADDGSGLTGGLLKATQIAENMEPAIIHPEQAKEAQAKLAALKKKTGAKPNILIFLVDDMGWGDPGVYGGGHAIGAPTPSIDRLAHQGLMLTSVYSQPTCTPTRAAMMTGRLPVRSGLTRATGPGERPTLGEEVLIAELLSEAGYHTALSGKWHLGESRGAIPTDVGYDEFYGLLSNASNYQDWQLEQVNPEIAWKPERVKAMKNRDYEQHLIRARKGEEPKQDKLITVDVTRDMDQWFADYSESVIRRSVDQKKPFFLIHSFSKVHYWNFPPEGYKGKSPAATHYHDAVVEVDDIVGRLVNVLQEKGQMENTFIFFTSDNGPEEDAWPDSGHTPFRGAKATTWEGGVRVPGIACWPGMIKAGRISDGLFDLMDLFNTTLTLAGAENKIPTDRYIDGVDQTSFLLADDGESCREAVFMWNQTQLAAIRWEEFKMHTLVSVIDSGVISSMGGKDVSYNVQPNFGGWFYNLYKDPKERRGSISDRATLVMPMKVLGDRHVSTFKKYPPKQGLGGIGN